MVYFPVFTSLFLGLFIKVYFARDLSYLKLGLIILLNYLFCIFVNNVYLLYFLLSFGIVFVLYLFTKSIYDAFFSIFIFRFIEFIIDIFILTDDYYSMSTIFIRKDYSIYQDKPYFILLDVLTLSLSLLILWVYKKFLEKKWEHKGYWMPYITSIFFLITNGIFIFLDMVKSRFVNEDDFIYVIKFYMGIIVLFILGFFTLYFIYLNNLQKLKLRKVEVYHIRNTLKEYLENDVNKIFTTIKQLLENQDIKKLKNYCQKINQNNMHFYNEYVQLNHIDDIILKVMLMEKLKLMDKSKVFLSIEPCHYQFMKIPIFYEVIGILIDNAIDASLKVKEPFLQITIQEEKSKVLVVIENNAIDEDLTQLKLKESNKGAKDRYNGLKILDNIIENSKEISLDTVIKHKTVTQSLTVHKG